MNLKKLKSPARATFKNPKIFWLIGKNFEVQPNITVKNKVGSLHKAMLFTFQI